MANLTQVVRGRIRDKILKHRFADDLAALDKKLREIGNAIYDAIYNEDERKLMNEAPTGFFALSVGRYVNYSRSGGSAIMVRWKGNKPVAFRDHYGYPVIPKDRVELLRCYEAVLDDEKKLIATRDAAGKEIDGILAGFRTYKALHTGWPEIADFIPPEPAVNNALARIPATVNDKFKLPPKGKEDAPAPAETA